MAKHLAENLLKERPGLSDVYSFAKAKHDATGAIRKNSGQPYWVHPSMVADICLAYGGTDEEIALALLHDTAEDTDTSYEEVAERYGENVAELLSEITNDQSEVNRLGKEEYINHELDEIDHPALFVKICDMLGNSLDNPKPGQAERMKRNLEHLLTYRGEDLTDKERRLIKAFPLMDDWDLDQPEFEDSYDDYDEKNYLLASRKMLGNKLQEYTKEDQNNSAVVEFKEDLKMEKIKTPFGKMQVIDEFVIQDDDKVTFCQKAREMYNELDKDGWFDSRTNEPYWYAFPYNRAKFTLCMSKSLGKVCFIDYRKEGKDNLFEGYKGPILLGAAALGLGTLSIADHNKIKSTADKLGIELAETEYGSHEAAGLIYPIYEYKYDMKGPMNIDSLCKYLKDNTNFDEITYDDEGDHYVINYIDNYTIHQKVGNATVSKHRTSEGNLNLPKNYFDFSFVLNEARVFSHSSGFGLSGHYDYETPEDEPLFVATETNEDDGELYFDETGCTTEFETDAKKFTSEEEALEFAKNNAIFGEPGVKLYEKSEYKKENTMKKLFENILDKPSLKEFFFYAPPHDNEEDEEDTIIGYIAAVRDYQTKKTKYIDGDGNVCDNKSQAKVFNTKGKADNYSYDHCPEGWTHFVVALKKSDILNEAETTKYMACCYDPEDYYEETNYIDEDGELSCNSSGAKLFNTEDEAIEYADENKPIGWMSFAMPARCESTLKETVENVIEGAWFYNQKTKDFITVPNGDESTHQEFFIENANLFFSKAEIDKFCRICKIKDLQELCSDSEFPGEYGFKFDTYLEMLTKKGWIKVRSDERNTFITCYEINRDTDGIFDLVETHPEIFLEGRLEKRIHIEGIENVQFITSTKKYVERDLINFEDFKG